MDVDKIIKLGCATIIWFGIIFFVVLFVMYFFTGD